MATAILFIGFGHPHNMQESEKAYAWFSGEGIAYLRKQEGSYVERVEPIALTPHGGDLAGAAILFGERAKLDELRRTDDFEAFLMNLGRRFDRVGAVPGLNWEGIQGVMKRINK